jgi:hypothetical protein
MSFLAFCDRRLHHVMSISSSKIEYHKVKQIVMIVASTRNIFDLIDTWEEMACLWFPPEDISNEFRDEGVVENVLLQLLMRYLS